ncbi:MAG: hypothetical protein IPL55_12085 [Saprospiraceae bacterium]|jgi:hypothetical protein|nr:hypothetical protein [Saprospiraceae bacterium]MBL0024178.1 hypothetical protein [Saprospiraceae bacterium]
MENNQSIRQAIDNGYDFKIGSYISKGFELFKQNPGGYIGFAILFFIISLVINMIPLFGFVIAVIVTPPLSVGIAIAVHKQENDGSMEFGNFFKGFDYIGQLIVAYIIMLLIYTVIAIPLILILGINFFSTIASGDPEAIMASYQEVAKLGVWIFFIGALFVYVGICTRWTNYLIVFHKYDAVTAIKTSWQLVNKRWIMHFLFLLVCGLLILLGFVALLVGIVVAYPVVMAADYAGYVDITGLNINSDSIDNEVTESDLI